MARILVEHTSCFSRRMDFRSWVIGSLVAFAFGCGSASGDPSSPGTATGGSGGRSGVGGSGNQPGGGGTDPGVGGSGTGGGSVSGSLALVVIDVQETFVDIANNPDKPSVVERTKAAFELGTQTGIPVMVTFEASMSGDHALHAPLVPFVSPQAENYVKTTFAATGLNHFASAVDASGATHLIVLGAETDVCVMQTVLGLRTLGKGVILQKDGVLSSETNPSPALRRMQQAGVTLADQTEVAAFAADPQHLPEVPGVPVRITRPLEVGVVLNQLTPATYGASADPLKSQKFARLRELLLVSEWFGRAVYVDDPAAGLPSELASYYKGPLLPISQLGSASDLTQLFFAGTDANLASALEGWLGQRELYVMEDALLATSSPRALKDTLAPFFDQGLVPTTYKSFYYDMTKSVALEQWPSQEWVQKWEEYYWITQAPEDLPPMPPE
jgi:nicotinamidase-related amidase